MNPKYYANTFQNMKTNHLREWLHIAQNTVDNAHGEEKNLICAGISAAATELLFRWRYNL